VLRNSPFELFGVAPVGLVVVDEVVAGLVESDAADLRCDAPDEQYDDTDTRSDER
jgi:hypothetical protein